MILRVDLPSINQSADTAVVEAIYPSEGSLLQPGSKLVDLKVDLSLAVAHDCPPITFHRIAVRERVWVRRILVSAGEEVPVGSVLALCSTAPDEGVDEEPARALRVSIIGILLQTDGSPVRVPLQLGPLAAPGYVVRRSGIRWRCEDMQACRAGRSSVTAISVWRKPPGAAIGIRSQPKSAICRLALF